MYLANSKQIRKADEVMIRDYGFPGILLMEKAGEKAADVILDQLGEFTNFLILCGPGNNGGDGMAVARLLHLEGKNVKLIFTHGPDQLGGDARMNFDLIQKLFEDMDYPGFVYSKDSHALAGELKDWADVLVDAVLGTGVEDELRGNVRDLIEFFKDIQKPVVAIDLPSGLDASSGKTLNEPIPATITVTFQVPKICHVITPAATLCGEVVVADIGMWDKALSGVDIRRQLISGQMVAINQINRPKMSHKGNYGHALLVGGKSSMAGAIALSTKSALQIGVGLATAFIPSGSRKAIYSAGFEIMNQTFGEKDEEEFSKAAIPEFKEAIVDKSVIVFGPGMGTSQGTVEFLKEALSLVKVPCVLDADALNILAANPDIWELIPPNSVITPHPGEMKKLCPSPDPVEMRLEASEKMIQDHHCHVVLKGANTIIAMQDGNTYVNLTGNPGMATAGAGDVLTGAIAGLIAQGIDTDIASWVAVYVHGYAGDMVAEEVGMAGVTAGKIADALSPALEAIKQNPFLPLPLI